MPNVFVCFCILFVVSTNLTESNIKKFVPKSEKTRGDESFERESDFFVYFESIRIFYLEDSKDGMFGRNLDMNEKELLFKKERYDDQEDQCFHLHDQGEHENLLDYDRYQISEHQPQQNQAYDKPLFVIVFMLLIHSLTVAILYKVPFFFGVFITLFIFLFYDVMEKTPLQIRTIVLLTLLYVKQLFCMIKEHLWV